MHHSRSVAAFAFLALAATSYAEADDAEPLPPGVEAAIDGYAQECTALGGTMENGADRPRILTADLDGDGREDYVLDPSPMVCGGAATAFCGNGGCNIDVALSSEDYQNPTRILGGVPTFEQDGTVLEVEVDSTNCDTTPDKGTCIARYVYRSGALQATYELGET
ncbi:hypothetical protein [Chelativorans salis]|uniref:Uncharacterized protein n=1 Tax=Chelativorans salis TaxID=2978478 RepID=A0ABT2LMS8_9HYPH|nr:hypothetical protein [Chelativorans sp. EGI FJ00035]MCT7374479.1 hypothetical protein [Chelativorans sp. EGI FJ00035]